jgi:hypothetical protein
MSNPSLSGECVESWRAYEKKGKTLTTEGGKEESESKCSKSR